jgi:hypothetical protein
MSLSVKVRRGGAAGATWIDYTPQVPLFSPPPGSRPLLDAGMMCANGSASQFQFIVDDDIGQIPEAHGTPNRKNLPAHTVVTISEDAPGFDCWLARGRIASKSIGRGEVAFGGARQFKVTVEDANVDLRGLTLTSDWARPAETDLNRVLQMLATFCRSSPRPSTYIDEHLVAPTPTTAMPKKTYPAGTELPEILADCATAAGKTYSVVIHHAGGSHLCLLYVAEGDMSSYVCDIGITDDAPDLVDWFPPEWDQGPAAVEEGQDFTTGLVSRYGGGEEEGFVFVNDAGDVSSYDYWVLPYSDTLSTTRAQATTRANAVREARSHERITHAVSITIPATEVHRICAGMSIQIRAAATMGGQFLNTLQTRRIAQLKWELGAPEAAGVPGFFKAHMQLDRPLRFAPMASGVGNPITGALARGATAIQLVQDLSIGGANLVKNSSFESRGNWHVGPHWTIEHNPEEPEKAYHGQRVARLEMTGDVPESGHLVNV